MDAISQVKLDKTAFAVASQADKSDTNLKSLNAHRVLRQIQLSNVSPCMTRVIVRKKHDVVLWRLP